MQPWPSATQLSTVVPAQRFAPAVQAEVQLTQLLPVQRVPVAHTAAFHCVQPLTTFQSQLSTPVAVQRDALMLHAWHELHCPPAHTSP